MRPLYFSAVAEHHKVAPALMRQAEKTLRPFDRYLGQAIRTTKDRQVRYELPWKRIGDLYQVTLKPVNHRLWVPRKAPGWRVTDWPPDAEFDATRKLVVVNRDLLLDVLDCERDGFGLRLRLEGELFDDDRVLWCGRPCTIAREPEPPPPSKVTTVDGISLRLSRPPEPDEDGWVLLVEGWSGDGNILLVDSERAQPRVFPWQDGLHRLRDSADHDIDLAGGTELVGDTLRLEDLPAEGLLSGDNGIQFTWRQKSKSRRGDAWVQLLPSNQEDSDDFLDHRAAFCEGELEEVWTQQRHRPETVFKVKAVKPEHYQLLLDRLPPKGTSLHLPVNVRNLQLQRRALRQLTEAPLPHHAGLLRLCEDPAPKRVRWPRAVEDWPDEWHVLTDETRDGTNEQRTFVAKALGSPDITLLEGPPGSGKTTAICELIWQLVSQGKRVLLCSSTHVAIDNVLELLIKAKAPVDPVRIGRVDRVDEDLQETQIDMKVEKLVKAWQAAPHLADHGKDELKDMAERTVVAAANLTCGTTMGIVKHPLFRDRDRDQKPHGRKPYERPITMMPHWDVLIVDETSKTFTQEFLVPALMAKRWVVVGDVRQLPPFADRADIVANLRLLTDEDKREVFPQEHRRARLLLYRLARSGQRQARWLVVEPPGVLDRLGEEWPYQPDPSPTAVRIVRRPGIRPGPFLEASVEQVCAGHPAALALWACDWVLVSDDLLPEVADHLPADLLHHRDPAGGKHRLRDAHPLRFRHVWWLEQAGRLPSPYRDRGDEITTFAEAEAHEKQWLANRDLAAEIVWRLTRIHELRRSRDTSGRDRLLQELQNLQPGAVDIAEHISEIQEIGLPGILEVLQEGIGADRATRPSALTEGMSCRQERAFRERFVSLTYQHRMHPDISAFPREVFYEGNSLNDANTVGDREIGWRFSAFPRRQVWVDVRGREHVGENQREIDVMEQIVREFLAWAKSVGPPQRPARPTWEVACLSFYAKQVRAISKTLRRVTGNDRQTRFTVGAVELVCATVDRFQGREADLVLLSMRNTSRRRGSRVGFLDSPNRLNVAVTRAREQLVVIGDAGNFRRSRISELEDLVERCHPMDARPWLGVKR